MEPGCWSTFLLSWGWTPDFLISPWPFHQHRHQEFRIRFLLAALATVFCGYQPLMIHALWILCNSSPQTSQQSVNGLKMTSRNHGGQAKETLRDIKRDAKWAKKIKQMKNKGMKTTTKHWAAKRDTKWNETVTAEKKIMQTNKKELPRNYKT